MKLFSKVIFASSLALNLNAQVFSVFLENDVINGEIVRPSGRIDSSHIDRPFVVTLHAEL